MNRITVLILVFVLISGAVGAQSGDSVLVTDSETATDVLVSESARKAVAKDAAEEETSAETGETAAAATGNAVIVPEVPVLTEPIGAPTQTTRYTDGSYSGAEIEPFMGLKERRMIGSEEENARDVKTTISTDGEGDVPPSSTLQIRKYIISPNEERGPESTDDSYPADAVQSVIEGDAVPLFEDGDAD